MGQESILSHLLQSGEFSDLRFCCNGEEFKVHKAVVCEQSPVIKAAIQGGFLESHSNTIMMDNFQTSTVRHLVQFMYTGDYEFGDAAETSMTDDDVVEEEGSSTERPPGFLLSKPASTALFEHLRVNSIGDYYKVDELVSLANKKITSLLEGKTGDDTPRHLAASIPTAIEEALESTSNEELFNILSSAIAANISTFLELDQFKSMSVMSDLSLKILQHCAQKIQLLIEENEEMQQFFLESMKNARYRIELYLEQRRQTAVVQH